MYTDASAAQQRADLEASLQQAAVRRLAVLQAKRATARRLGQLQREYETAPLDRLAGAGAGACVCTRACVLCAVRGAYGCPSYAAVVLLTVRAWACHCFYK